MIKVKLDILGALDEAWGVIKKNKMILGVILVINIMVFIANNLLVEVPVYDPETIPTFSPEMISMQVKTLFFLFLFFMINNMILLVVKHHKNDTEYHFSELPWPAFTKVFVAIAASILLMFALLLPNIIVGFILAALGPVGIIFFVIYIIGIVFLMFTMTFIGECIVFEDAGPIKAIKHSFIIVSHNFLRLLLFYLVTGALVLLIAFSTAQIPVISYLIMPVQAGLGVFITVVSGLIYAQCLVKKEDTVKDIEVL